jgi:hypothetical protein
MNDFERHETMERRITELEEALLHLLEVQVKPSTDHEDEWIHATADARRVLRRKA